VSNRKAFFADTERFYRATGVPACRRLEQLVLGSDWGGNGYTTFAQARRLLELLDLGPGRRLLDVGSGRGWPGLYMAATSGCDVVLTDVPAEALREGADRTRQERLCDRAFAVRATGERLPFRPRTFDAVVHTDVLC